MDHKKSKHWYVVYTLFKAEKRVGKVMDLMGIESFIPVHEFSKVKNGKEYKINEVLFPNFVFIRACCKAYFKAIKIPGVVRFLRVNEKICEVSNYEIQLIRKIQSVNPKVVCQKIKGEHKKISSGPLVDFEGLWIENDGCKKILIRISSINKEILVDATLESMKITKNN